ncbi:MAG: hypothetical protein AAGG44_01465 [Planctomycetota bacterium]
MQTNVHWQLYRRPIAQSGGAKQDSTPEFGTDARSDSRVFDCSFEEVVEALAKLPGMFIELDGSFVIRQQTTDSHPESTSQMDGMIYDRVVELSPSGNRESRVHWCDIQGSFSELLWDEVWSCFETPNEELLVYDVQSQTYLARSELFSD